MEHDEKGKYEHKIRLTDGSTIVFSSNIDRLDWPGQFFRCVSRNGTCRTVNTDHVIYIDSFLSA